MNSPKRIAEIYSDISVNKINTPWYKMLLLAAIAGMFIALGGAASTIASSTVEGSIANLIKGAVFPVGLSMVVIAGSELFTGNCLMIIGVLEKRFSAWKLTKSLALVYFGNFIGSVLIAAIVVYGGTLDKLNVYTAVIATAEAKASLTFLSAFLQGIPANILVCIGVWMMLSTDNIAGKILAMYLPIMAFVICGFEHSVANMYYFSAGLMALGKYPRPISVVSPLVDGGGVLLNMLGSTLGNLVGGMGFVALPYWLLYLKKPGVAIKSEEDNENVNK